MASLFESTAKPHLFAHRGGNAGGAKIENTKRAFNSAVRLGYKFLETDVITTKDGHVICYHGAHNWYTKRYSGLELRKTMQRLTYKEINELHALNGEKIPKLGEILDAFPDVCFSVDVKTRQVVKPLVSLLQQKKAADRVIITSFSLWRALRANRWLRGHTKGTSLCLSRFSAKIISPVNFIFLPVVKKLGVGYLQVSHSRISKRLVNLSHRYGISVYAWTVNDAASIRRLLDIKTDGIMSDESKLLLSIAKAKK